MYTFYRGLIGSRKNVRMKLTVFHFNRHTVLTTAPKMIRIFRYLFVGAVVGPLSFGRDLPDATSKVLIFSDQLNDNPGSADFNNWN